MIFFRLRSSFISMDLALKPQPCPEDVPSERNATPFTLLSLSCHVGNGQDLGGRRATKDRKSSTGDGNSSIVCSGGGTPTKGKVVFDPRVGELLSLGVALRRQEDDTVQKVVRLQRSSVGIVTMLRKVQAGLQVLSTKDLFWKVSC